MPPRDDREAGDQLTFRKLFRERRCKPDVDVQIRVVVLNEAVPSAFDTEPVNVLSAQTLHVGVIAKIDSGPAGRRYYVPPCSEIQDRSGFSEYKIGFGSLGDYVGVRFVGDFTGHDARVG